MKNTSDTNDTSNLPCAKVVFAGYCSGRTSLINRFLNGTFEERINATIGTNIDSKNVSFQGHSFEMMIMDPNGLERNSCMRSMYYPQGDVFVIVFSIRERYTFDRIKDFYGEITKVVNNPTIFLCANKCDLTVGNEVTHEEGIKMAQEIHAVEYIKTSALTGEGVDELFEKIIEKCYIAKENESKNSQPANNVNQENKNKNCEIA